jgi:RNA polymerase sigma-70 factor (ECF subfamily)
VDLQQATDGELTQHCLGSGGSQAQAAFRVLYERHAPSVRRFLTAWLGDEVAPDALQETFFRAYVKLERYDRQRSLRGWLFGIARNVAHHDHRARVRRPVASWPAVDPPAGGETPNGQAQRSEERDLVRAAVQRLPAREREVFLLKQVEGLTFAEVAQATGGSVRTAKYRMRAAADLLAADLARSGLLPAGRA